MDVKPKRIAILTGLVIVALAVWLSQTPIESWREARSRRNITVVYHAIEDYCLDQPGWEYPVDLDELISRGYLACWPLNPYSGKPLRQMPVGSYSPGDFSYLGRNWQPVSEDGSGGQQPNYLLFSYAAQPKAKTIYVNLLIPTEWDSAPGAGRVRVDGVAAVYGSGWSRYAGPNPTPRTRADPREQAARRRLRGRL